MASYGLLAGNCGSCSCSIAVDCIGVEGVVFLLLLLPQLWAVAQCFELARRARQR